MGGTQDNGAWWGPSQNRNSWGVFAADWNYLPTGDAYYVLRDWWNPNFMYYESQFGASSRIDLATGQISPLAGKLRLGSGVRLGYMDQEQANLDPALNPLTSLFKVGAFNETEARSFLSLYLFKGDDVFTPVGKLSYGERARLSLALLVGSGCNLLLLDEPVNHLDIPARGRFEQALGNFHGTVLAVAHDRYFIQAIATHVWQVAGGHVRSIEM